jgi:hypothetical protein
MVPGLYRTNNHGDSFVEVNPVRRNDRYALWSKMKKRERTGGGAVHGGQRPDTYYFSPSKYSECEREKEQNMNMINLDGIGHPFVCPKYTL